MPRYNGVFAYPLEVLLHLLRCYAAFAFVMVVVLPLPFVIIALVGGHFDDAWRPWVSLPAGAPVFYFVIAHNMTFATFRGYFAPRFPYAPAMLTFAIAALFGSVIVAASWCAETLVVDGGASIVELPKWFVLEPRFFLERLMWSTILTVGVGAFGAFIYKFGGRGGVHNDLGKWLGWLIMGRAAFDAFLARDQERLLREYDEYVQSVRGR